MIASLSVFGMNQDFDAFLYAPVGGEIDQMPLSVLSALARLNLDPWGEASELAKLPQEKAARRLAGLIVRLPAAQVGKIDSATTAERLVSLLPRATRSISLPASRGVSLELPKLAPRTVVILLSIIVLGAAALFAAVQGEAWQTARSDIPSSSRYP